MPLCQIYVIMVASLVDLEIFHQVFADFFLGDKLPLSWIFGHPLLMWLVILSFDKWIIDGCQERKYDVFPFFL